MAEGIYECSIRSASIPAAGTYNIVFTTLASPAIFVARTIGFSGSGAEANIYEAPTGVAGGTLSEIFPTDLYFNPTPQGVFRHGVTITTPGTKRAATSFYRGSTGVGQSVVGTYASAGGSRRLKANTTYLLQFTNADAEAQTFDVYFRWYEGGATMGG